MTEGEQILMRELTVLRCARVLLTANLAVSERIPQAEWEALFKTLWTWEERTGAAIDSTQEDPRE